MGKIERQEGELDKCFISLSLLFPPLSRQEKEAAAYCCQTTLAPEAGEHSLKDALETLIWARMFQGCYLNVLDSSEMLSASLYQGWETFQGLLLADQGGLGASTHSDTS